MEVLAATATGNGAIDGAVKRKRGYKVWIDYIKIG